MNKGNQLRVLGVNQTLYSVRIETEGKNRMIVEVIIELQIQYRLPVWLGDWHDKYTDRF
jgi:hypothetical protein